jgi:ATP/maltotriose-dependent transcriptional regulator MalT
MATLHLLGHLLLNQGELARAEELLRETLALAREHGQTDYISYALLALAMTAAEQGNYAAAHTLFEEGVPFLREAESPGLPGALCNWALLALRQGEYDRARALAEEGLALSRERGMPPDIAYALLPLSQAAFYQGDVARARTLAEEGVRLCVQDRYHLKPDLLLHLGEIFLQQGDPDQARAFAEESLARHSEMGTTNAICSSLNLLGKIASVQGNGAAARTYHEQSLELASKRGLRLQIPSGLEGLARAVAAQGEPLWAARLWGAARALRDSMGAPLPPIYRADYERSVATARLELGAQVFDAAWSEGHAMTAEQVLGSPGRVQRFKVVDNSDFSPNRLTVPLDSSYPSFI